MRIGTRGSALALAQTALAAAALDEAEIVVVATDDSAVGDKSRFVGGLEQALLAGEIDAAVHSAKDLPGELAFGTVIAAVPTREDRRDVLVGTGFSGLDELRSGARVGTSSLRRRSQLLARRDDIKIVQMRGNVDSRLSRIAADEFDAIVLAAAGMIRLGRGSEISVWLAEDEVLPAAGQGALVFQARADDSQTIATLTPLDDPESALTLACERAAVRALNADCDSAVGASARLDGDELTVQGFVGAPDGSEWIRDVVAGSAADPVALGQLLAWRLTGAGAEALIAAARETT